MPSERRQDDLDEIANKVARLDIDSLMTMAVEFLRRDELELAETMVDRVAHLIRVKRINKLRKEAADARS